MISVCIAFAFGFLQALLLKSMLLSFTAGNYQKAAAAMLVKFFFYAAAIALLIVVFPAHIKSSVIGYSVGLPLTVTVRFIYNAFCVKNADSGDGKNENSNNN